jgi:hypothetical protein
MIRHGCIAARSVEKEQAEGEESSPSSIALSY